MKTLRVSDVADRLSVHEKTVWRWVREGVFIKPFKLGRAVCVWDEADVNNWLLKNKEVCYGNEVK
jgi:excisionase family DNA binding protein